MKRKEAYLTIDDCPSKDFRKKIDFLKNKKVSAVLFCIGKLMEERSDDMIYAIKKGFIIGNHSYSHPSFNLMSIRRAYDEIKRTDEIIEVLYMKAGVKRKFKLFRFPYGNKGGSFSFRMFFNWTSLRDVLLRKKKKMEIQKILRNLGYEQPKLNDINYQYFKKLGFDKDADVFWTYDFEEYWRKDLKEIYSLMDSDSRSQGGSIGNRNSAEILLIHDHDNTSEAFFGIINELIRRKVKFRSIK